MRYKERVERRTGLKLKEATKYELGKTYYCGYWGKTFKVLEIKPSEIWGEVYKCLWSDGFVTTHSTAIEPDYDYEVIEKEGC